MQKNRSIARLILAISPIGWHVSDEAMLHGKKLIKKVVGSLASTEFQKLIKKQTVDEQELADFYGKVFRKAVRRHVKHNEPYTECLGMAVDKKGKLTMEQLPTTEAEGKEIAIAMAQLYKNPSDTSLLETVKAFYQKKKNPTKDATPFFPQIIVKTAEEVAAHFKKLNQTDKAPKDLPALFDPTTMQIVVSRDAFKPEYCHIILHEFIHFLQMRTGLELCAGYYRTLTKPALPLNLAIELEADLLALDMHPDKSYALKHYAKALLNTDYTGKHALCKEVLGSFPHITPALACSYLLKKSDPKTGEQYPETTKLIKGGSDLFFTMIRLTIEKRQETIAQEKSGKKIFGLGGTDYPEEVLKLKKKLGLLPTVKT
ncbi:MAG: hypothetical protein M1549_01175 [Candidatus Dependentiae bacterium]|nr:hypothetical protein [Candidatus Dependentiae bacterium]